MRFLVMDHTGHSTLEMDTSTEESRAAAAAKFLELTGAGYTPAKMRDGAGGEIIRKFDPTAEDVLFIPRLAGG